MSWPEILAELDDFAEYQDEKRKAEQRAVDNAKSRGGR